MAQIDKPNLHFNTLLWQGNGNNARALTGVGFQPDFTWIKDRDDTESHCLTDAVRGATKSLRSNGNNAEATDTDALQSFNSDGFTVGNQGQVNKSNGDDFVGWNWKAGGGQGSSNTDGSINTTYTSVNTTAGFSISKYTGTGANATIGHGLGVAPAMMIIKATSFTEDWIVYHQSTGNTEKLDLNTANAADASVTYWNNTSPTSSVFSVGTNDRPNKSGATYVAYCFAEKKGYSKFGSYTGNGNSNGSFIYLGFKPAFFMIKRTESSGDKWRMWDNKRSPFNLVDDSLACNENSAEYDDASVSLDFLSNGVKMRMSGGGAGNGSGESYIYMAFAEEPIVGTNNVAATAK